jgi:hypothetical protein
MCDIIRVKTDTNPLNAKLNPICHLLALLGAYHILHISRVRVKRWVNSHLLALLGAHHILHIRRIRVKRCVNSHLLALLGAHHILHISRVRVKRVSRYFSLWLKVPGRTFNTQLHVKPWLRVNGVISPPPPHMRSWLAQSQLFSTTLSGRARQRLADFSSLIFIIILVICYLNLLAWRRRSLGGWALLSGPFCHTLSVLLFSNKL